MYWVYTFNNGILAFILCWLLTHTLWCAASTYVVTSVTFEYLGIGHLGNWLLECGTVVLWVVFFLTGYWASFEWYSHCILKLVTHTFPCEYVYHKHSLIKYPCLQPRSAVIKMCMHVVILLNRETIIFRSFCGPWCCSARLEVSCFHLFVHAANTFF